jgi:hypothetical protein
MKKILSLFLFALITTLSSAQSNYQDVVYLKNGSVIRGIIIEQVPNKSIKIETSDGSVFFYQLDEIEKLTKEAIQRKTWLALSNSGLQPGYRGIVELGYRSGIGYSGMDGFKLNIINGYQVNPYFFLGFGTGIRYYSDAQASAIPLFADLRANFMDNKISPYLSLGVGYSFDPTNEFEGIFGFLLNPNLGVSFKVSDKSAMNVGIGYEMQQIKVYDYFYGEYNKNSSAISIDVGISF